MHSSCRDDRATVNRRSIQYTEYFVYNTLGHLEVDVVGEEEKPGPRALARAEAKDLGHVLSAEGRVRHDHVVLRDRSVFHHLAMDMDMDKDRTDTRVGTYWYMKSVRGLATWK